MPLSTSIEISGETNWIGWREKQFSALIEIYSIVFSVGRFVILRCHTVNRENIPIILTIFFSILKTIANDATGVCMFGSLFGREKATCENDIHTATCIE